MKRSLRVFVRIITSPVVLFFFMAFYIVSLCFVFQEWLFENADKFYSFAHYHKDLKKDFAKYFKNFFR